MSEPNTNPTLVYYDGWCSACTKSADLFMKLDTGRGLVVCVDFRSDAKHMESVDIDPSALAASLHAVAPDGEILSGPDAIRRVFMVLGKKHAASWTALPIIRPIVDIGYRIFARNRLRWFANHTCKDGVCSSHAQDRH